MPSFDAVSKVEMQEVVNAVDQTKREIGTRYDFKGSKSSIELKELLITIMADDDMKLKAVQEIIKQKLSKRGVSLKCCEFKDAQKAGGDMLRQEVIIKQGLTDVQLKKLVKMIKEKGFKVQASIQGSELRVSGKKRDDLQDVIGFLRTNATDMELQFDNFRE